MQFKIPLGIPFFLIQWHCLNDTIPVAQEFLNFTHEVKVPSVLIYDPDEFW